MQLRFPSILLSLCLGGCVGAALPVAPGEDEAFEDQNMDFIVGMAFELEVSPLM